MKRTLIKKAYVSETSNLIIRDYLKDNGYEVNVLSSNDSTYYPVSSHSDIFMCKLGLWDNPTVFYGNKNSLGASYPKNIIYNGVCTNKFFIHNLRHTDKKLLEQIHIKTSTNSDFRLVNVRQGYTRCCCLPVDDTSFITSDLGIARALIDAGADVLTIDKGHIVLPTFDYGFIGGCTGHLIINGKRTIVFNGNLAAHPDYESIIHFIKSRCINPVFFKDYPLTDIGSIITLW